MIKLDTQNDGGNLFQEGILQNALASAKSTSKDSGTPDPVPAKKKLNVEDINNVNKTLGKVQKAVDSQTVNTSSIVARAKNSVLQFPVYVTQSIRVNEAHIIGKMFERVYATLVQTVLSHNLIINEEEANNLVFLKRFHTNLQESTEVLVNKYYEAIDDIDKMMCESIFHKAQLTDDCYVEFRVVPTTDDVLIMENSRLCNEPLHGFMYLQEARKDEPREPGSIRSSEKRGETADRIIHDDELQEMVKKNPSIGTVEALKKAIKSGQDVAYKGGHIRVRKDKKGDLEYYMPGKEGTIVTRENESAVDAPKLLKDSDIKKINGILPFTIEATFRMRTKNSDGSHGVDRDVRYVIGIKTVMHLISTKDLGEDLRGIITGNVKTLQKVRYKTGEISFKDYFFNIKGLKADAAKHINYDKRWLNTLKRLGEYEKMNGTLLKKGIQAITGGHVPIPNGTLILSQPEVTKLTNETGIDLSIVSNAKRLAKELFLIGIVIVDSTAGTMRVLFPDSDSSWDVQSLAAIDAELSKTDNSQLMKELNRMMVHK